MTDLRAKASDLEARLAKLAPPNAMSGMDGMSVVNQCYLCHLTKLWNDIKGVVWNKHR